MINLARSLNDQPLSALGLPAFMALDGGGAAGGNNSLSQKADIAPGRIPERFEKVTFLSNWGVASLRLATSSGEVPNVWDNDKNIWKGGTHSFNPGDVILTYGPAQNKGVPIVDKDGHQLTDIAVSADPTIIALTYMDANRSRYLNRGTQEKPVIDLDPGVEVQAVKRAPVTLLLGVPEGTLIATLETESASKPPIVLQKGQVVAVGVVGEPYVMSAARFLERNEPDGKRAIEVAEAIRTELK